MDGSFIRAMELLFSGEREVYFIAFTSIKFSLISTIISAVLAVPLGVLLALKNFFVKRGVIIVLNSLMALPTVVIGLFVYSFLSRSGSLGHLGILFTPTAIVIGQSVLILPIISSMVYSGLSKLDPRLRETLVTLGASSKNIFVMILKEGKTAILSAILAGFGRVIGEVGISMMLGGNIRWYTRTITTTIALETSKGEFELALALGVILIILALLINFALHGAVRYGK
ncbi:MAG: ABC transporter permease [Spirochaetota bacterium]